MDTVNKSVTNIREDDEILNNESTEKAVTNNGEVTKIITDKSEEKLKKNLTSTKEVGQLLKEINQHLNVVENFTINNIASTSGNKPEVSFRSNIATYEKKRARTSLFTKAILKFRRGRARKLNTVPEESACRRRSRSEADLSPRKNSNENEIDGTSETLSRTTSLTFDNNGLKSDSFFEAYLASRREVGNNTETDTAYYNELAKIFKQFSSEQRTPGESDLNTLLRYIQEQAKVESSYARKIDNLHFSNCTDPDQSIGAARSQSTPNSKNKPATGTTSTAQQSSASAQQVNLTASSETNPGEKSSIITNNFSLLQNSPSSSKANQGEGSTTSKDKQGLNQQNNSQTYFEPQTVPGAQQNQQTSNNLYEEIDQESPVKMDLQLQRLIRTVVQNLPSPTNEPADIIRFLDCAQKEYEAFNQQMFVYPNLRGIFIQALTQKLNNQAYSIVNRARPANFEQFKKVLISQSNIIRPRKVVEAKANSTIQFPGEAPLSYFYRLEDLMKEFNLAVDMEELTNAQKQEIKERFAEELLLWAPAGLNDNLAASARTRNFASFEDFRNFLQAEKDLQERRKYCSNGTSKSCFKMCHEPVDESHKWRHTLREDMPAFAVTERDSSAYWTTYQQPQNSAIRELCREIERLRTSFEKERLKRQAMDSKRSMHGLDFSAKNEIKRMIAQQLQFSSPGRERNAHQRNEYENRNFSNNGPRQPSYFANGNSPKQHSPWTRPFQKHANNYSQNQSYNRNMNFNQAGNFNSNYNQGSNPNQQQNSEQNQQPKN